MTVRIGGCCTRPYGTSPLLCWSRLGEDTAIGSIGVADQDLISWPTMTRTPSARKDLGHRMVDILRYREMRAQVEGLPTVYCG